MPRAKTNGIELEYEVFGDGEPLLLIMGLGAQLVHWPDELCAELARRGFRVVRFDNRDVGLSTKLKGRVGDLRLLFARRLLGLPIAAPYRLEDMADDVAGLLDALGLPDAHVLGVSMGGMIAQTVAIRHPARVRSLTSIMSSTGARRFLLGRPLTQLSIIQRVPRQREAAIEHELRVFMGFAGGRLKPSASELRAILTRAYDRCHYPPGFVRQLAAIFASGDRTAQLRRLRVPAAVLHGGDDPLVLPGAGRATAAAIPGARLRIIDGMGHGLPSGAWPIVYEELERLVARAGNEWCTIAPDARAGAGRGGAVRRPGLR